jgi:hypothetical protein
MHRFAQSEAGEVQGRWAKPAQVTGSEGAVHMPRLPENSPWSCDPVPPEAPLGIDVSETPIVGEPHEVEASLNADFGLLRSLSDGVPPATGSPVSRSPEPTPDAEATRVNLTKERTSLASSVGRHSMSPRRVSPNNIKRRLR